MIRPHIVSIVLSSVALILNFSLYVSEGGLDVAVDNVATRWRINSLIPTGNRSDLSLVLTCGGMDGDVCGASSMGGRISATFLAAHSRPFLGILCRKAEIGE